MINNTSIYKKLAAHCPSDYQINEIIRFAYPYRRIRLKATVNKSPEKSMQQVYTVFLKTVLAGYQKEAEIINFLGLHPKDFILQELSFLSERGYLDFINNNWEVTAAGKAFIADSSILRVLEEEDFEFLIDGITDKAISKDFKTHHSNDAIKKLAPSIAYGYKDPDLLNNKNEQLSDIYKQDNNHKAYLVDYDKSNIQFDSFDKEYCEYYLIEYKPIFEKEEELETYIEIRNTDKSFSKNVDKKWQNVLKEYLLDLI